MLKLIAASCRMHGDLVLSTSVAVCLVSHLRAAERSKRVVDSLELGCNSNKEVLSS